MSVSHHHQPLAVREHYSLSQENCSDIQSMLHNHSFIQEFYILSTCNRTEFYFITGDVEKLHSVLTSVYAAINPDLIFDITHWKQRSGMEAINHFFRVCSGIDSMIVGETQITFQIKDALKIAQSNNMTGFYLTRLIQAGLETGKKVRTDTDISKGAYSVSFAAVEKIKALIPDFIEKRILLIGAGNTGKLTASLFRKKGCRKILVSNRNAKRGIDLAKQIEAKFVAFDSIQDQLTNIDIIVTCTQAPSPVVTSDHIHFCKRDFVDQPLIMVDLSVPRNIQPDLAEVHGISLFTIDDLDGVVKYSTDLRKKELPKVEQIIDEKVADFEIWIKDRSVSPVIADLKHHLEDVRSREFDRIRYKYDEETLNAIFNFSTSLIRKTIKEPIQVLKSQALDNQYPDTLVESLRHLFKLNGAENRHMKKKQN